MKVSRIFRWVWRINAVMFLIGSVALLSIIGVAVYPTIKDYVTRKPIYHAHNMVNTEDVQIDSEWTLGGFSQISNTDFLISPVFSKQEYSVGSGGIKQAGATRNYLFLNSIDKSTRWLANTNKYLFLQEDTITDRAQPIAKAIAMKFRLVKDDTNGDNRLTSDDKVTLALSNLDGTSLTELVSGIDEFLSENQPDADTLLLIYRSDGKNLLIEIKISEKKVVQTKELPRING